MRMRQLWHFRFAQFFLVLCLFSRKFYRVYNKQLSLLLQQKSLKEYAFLFLNFISFSGKEIPKILAAMQGVRTSVSVLILTDVYCSVVRDTGGLLSGCDVNLVSSSTVV